MTMFALAFYGIAAFGLGFLFADHLRREQAVDDGLSDEAYGDAPFIPTINQPRGD